MEFVVRNWPSAGELTQTSKNIADIYYMWGEFTRKTKYSYAVKSFNKNDPVIIIYGIIIDNCQSVSCIGKF